MLAIFVLSNHLSYYERISVLHWINYINFIHNDLKLGQIRIEIVYDENSSSKIKWFTNFLTAMIFEFYHDAAKKHFNELIVVIFYWTHFSLNVGVLITILI